MRIPLSLIFFLFVCWIQAQNIKAIEAEGKLLYRLEKASWYAKDIFVDTYHILTGSTGGYVSYPSSENLIITSFYDKEDPSLILVRFTFQELPEPEPIEITAVPSPATSNEQILIAMRETVKKELQNNSEGFFQFYKGSAPNVIPLLRKNELKTYIISASTEQGKLLLGNDYELIFDKKFNIKRKRKLHNSLIAFDFQGEEHKIESTMHSHVLSDFITVTDICTLLLYKDFLSWDFHYVLGKKYITLFDLKRESLVMMKLKAWKKISNFKK